MKFSIHAKLLLLLFFLHDSIPSFGQKSHSDEQIFLQHDNDIFQPGSKTDEFYSFGLILGYRKLLNERSKLGDLMFFISDKSQGKTTYGMTISQKGYTPKFDENLSGGDFRPFAGILMADQELVYSRPSKLIAMGLSMGVRGEISGAEWVQDHFHELIDTPVFEAWDTQLSNKFLFGINGKFAFEIPLLSWIDLVPETSFALGNYQTNLQQAAMIRVGLFNSLDNTHYFRTNLNQDAPRQREFYLTFKGFGRAILTDATLGKPDGSDRETNPLNKRNRLAGYEMAFHMQWNKLGLAAALNRISTDSNFSEKHIYGSMAFSLNI